MTKKRDHGGGLDAAIRQYGGDRADWLDLSTGINPEPYPLPALAPDTWTALPDEAAFADLYASARKFWNIPEGADIIAATGASAIIAAIPRVLHGQTVEITKPTYNEHAAAFVASGWREAATTPDVQVVVHPNNPDGRLWQPSELSAPIKVIDESFCDVCPLDSLIALAAQPKTVVLKSFGKFWGLAGMRLGFAVGDPKIIAQLRALLGPWQVNGPALATGRAALDDSGWAEATRARLAKDADRLDQLMAHTGAQCIGGTTLFRLYDVADAAAFQHRLAQHRVWSRIFPYSQTWLRLGLPAADRWTQLEAAL